MGVDPGVGHLVPGEPTGMDREEEAVLEWGLERWALEGAAGMDMEVGMV